MADRIRDLMTPAPLMLTEQDTAADAARLMKEHDVGDVLVRDVDGTLRGIVTDRDLVVRCLAEQRDGEATKLGELCTEDVDTLDADASVDEAVALMRSRAVRRIPIVDQGELVGIVSLGDLARERDPESALGKISAAPATP
jgi:CBS domain-containing protein